jgi:beta-glucanase (GH16 family)
MMKKSICDSKSLFLLILVVIFGSSGFVLATPGDIDGDGYVNAIDLSLFADQWLETGCSDPNLNWCGGADINHNGNVDFNDFAFLAQNWSPVMPIWSDEFDGTSLDMSKWNIYDKADGSDSWYRPQNVAVYDGTLKIYNYEELYNGRHWTGGYIDTAPASSAHPQYKYLVARVKHSDPDIYIWATWWTVGWVGGSLVWPPELDICEVMGGPGASPGQTYHWNGAAGGDVYAGCSTGVDESQWHTYGAYWTATRAPVFYVDGIVSCAPNGPVSGALMPMKLKLTSSPNSMNRYSGCPLGTMEVDYVRVYDAPPPPPPGIVSQDKPATASSAQSANAVANANDGGPTTRWSASSAAYPQWWKVDLGASCNLTRTDINWYSTTTRAYKYKIEVSADDITYITVVDNTGNTTYGDTSDSFTATGRYVRVTITGCTNVSAYASAYEIKVYGN